VKTLEAFILFEGGHAGAFALQAGTLVVMHDSVQFPPRLSVVDREGEADEAVLRRIESFNDAVVDAQRFGRHEEVWYRGALDDQVQMWLIYPPDFDPKKKYPMLVDVHGGGPGSRLYLMGGLIGSLIERHLWATRGFVVLVPDYRTAAPYGPGVIERMRGRAFSPVDNRDIMAGVDWMVSRGYVDPDRIALLGQSAGAHRANVLLPTTRRFKVAISNEGWANAWIGDSTGVNTGHVEWPINVWFFKGNRIENPQAYFDEDPLQRLQDIRTPTLLISGSKELGGIGEMTNEYIFSMLKRAGVDVKLIQFADEGHGTTKRANRRFVVQSAIDWVEKYCKASANGAAR